jgi:hypothetical protein
MFTFRHTWWHVTLFVKVSSRNIWYRCEYWNN